MHRSNCSVREQLLYRWGTHKLKDGTGGNGREVMERCGVTTILSWKLETFNRKSRIQRLGVACTVWLIRGCLPKTCVSWKSQLSRLAKCWWRKDSAVTVPQAPKNPYAELAAVVCA